MLRNIADCTWCHSGRKILRGVAGLAIIGALAAGGSVAGAAEVKVLAAPNMRPILGDLAPEFERTTGNKLVISYAAPSLVNSRIEAGEATDVVVTLRGMLDDLSKQGKTKDVITVGRSFIAVVVPAGKPKPDISSLAAFKQTLLAAKSIVHSDPTKGGLSGIFTARLITAMGIDDQIKPKLKLVPPGGEALVAAVASGEAELGIDRLTVVDHKPGVDVVGLLSAEFGVDIVMGAGLAAGANEPAAAADLVKFLSSPTAAPVIKARGMEPG